MPISPLQRPPGPRALACATSLVAPLVLVSLVGLAGARPAPPAHRAAAPALRPEPPHVRRGGTVVLHGSSFPARVHVTLVATRDDGKARRIGSAVAGRAGNFLAPIQIDSHAAPGLYVVRACSARCRVKAGTRFRVLKP